jgi:hypothetical protein
MKPNRLQHPIAAACLVALIGAITTASCSAQRGQHADSTYDTSVKHPAYGPKHHPRVVVDEAHRNFHTSVGRYRPFADLVMNDGYSMDRGSQKFTRDYLNHFDVLVVSNALGPEDHEDSSAFTPGEIAAVRDWVQDGGRLLLIADHWPFGGAAAKLSEAFGVDMSLGATEDTVNCAPSTSGSGRREPSALYFTRANGLLLDHPITKGVTTVETFTGQSLGVPAGATPFLKRGITASDRKPEPHEERVGNDIRVTVDYGDPTPAAGRAQGVALEQGKGRVVILGEAAMMTAQISGAGDKFGMNVSGIDNKQLALNIMHWLSRLD